MEGDRLRLEGGRSGLGCGRLEEDRGRGDWSRCGWVKED